MRAARQLTHANRTIRESRRAAQGRGPSPPTWSDLASSNGRRRRQRAHRRQPRPPKAVVGRQGERDTQSAPASVPARSRNTTAGPPPGRPRGSKKRVGPAKGTRETPRGRPLRCLPPSEQTRRGRQPQTHRGEAVIRPPTPRGAARRGSARQDLNSPQVERPSAAASVQAAADGNPNPVPVDA